MAGPHDSTFTLHHEDARDTFDRTRHRHHTSGLYYAAARLLDIEGCAVNHSSDAALLKFAEGMLKACTEKGKAAA